MRRRQLKALWRWLGQLQQMKLSARNLLTNQIGRSKGSLPDCLALNRHPAAEPTTEGIASFSFALNRQKLRQVRRRQGPLTASHQPFRA
jgi:hypothetical protein